MAQITKYRAKHVYWDSKNCIVLGSDKIEQWRINGKLELPDHIWRFDSQHEFKVYLQLVRIFGVDRIVRQYKLQVMPPSCCFPSGKHWRVDFAIISKTPLGGYSHYIEAKGAFLPEFGNVLSNLELNNSRVFNRTWIIFTEQIPTRNKVVKTLSKTEHKSRLLTLKELEQLTTLL